MPFIETVLPEPDYPVARRWARHKVDLPVRIVIPRWIRNTVAQAHGYYLNCGGIAIHGIKLCIGKQVFLEFESPFSGQLTRMWGVVRNHYADRYGIEFICEDKTG